MVRSIASLILLCVTSLSLAAQPTPESLLANAELADEDVRPTFRTFTPEQVHAAVNVTLAEVEHGDARVPAISVALPDADNDAYGSVVFEAIELTDRDGAPIEWNRTDGMIVRSGREIQLVLLAPDGESGVPLGSASGRIKVWYPTSVRTRTIKASDKDSLAKEAVAIDGPYVRYHVDPNVAQVRGALTDVESVRAYDAAGKRIEPDGGFYPDEEAEGFELRPFRGAVARAEVDGVSEVAVVSIEFELEPGAAPKLVKTAHRTMPVAVLDFAMGMSREQIEQGLAQQNYTAIDDDQFMMAVMDNQVDAVRLFLAADFDFEKGPTPPLMAAAVTGRFEVANLLLDAGADASAKDDMGISILMRLASDCDATPMIEKLLARGADPNDRGSSPVSPLALAKAVNCNGNAAAIAKAGGK